MSALREGKKNPLLDKDETFKYNRMCSEDWVSVSNQKKIFKEKSKISTMGFLIPDKME